MKTKYFLLTEAEQSRLQQQGEKRSTSSQSEPFPKEEGQQEKLKLPRMKTTSERLAETSLFKKQFTANFKFLQEIV